jgi:hypothetical protein
MAVVKQRPWLARLAAVLIAVAGVTAPMIASAPAQARVVFSFGFGVPGNWGYYPPPGYYPYRAYYPYYYRYPYAYPAGVYFGHPFYHRRWHRRYWR